MSAFFISDCNEPPLPDRFGYSAEERYNSREGTYGYFSEEKPEAKSETNASQRDPVELSAATIITPDSTTDSVTPGTVESPSKYDYPHEELRAGYTESQSV